jgi:hypothetical protein
MLSRNNPFQSIATSEERRTPPKTEGRDYTKMMLSGGGIAATGSTNVHVAKRNAKSATGMSKMGISTRKRNADKQSHPARGIPLQT